MDADVSSITMPWHETYCMKMNTKVFNVFFFFFFYVSSVCGIWMHIVDVHRLLIVQCVQHVPTSAQCTLNAFECICNIATCMWNKVLSSFLCLPSIIIVIVIILKYLWILCSMYMQVPFCRYAYTLRVVTWKISRCKQRHATHTHTHTPSSSSPLSFRLMHKHQVIRMQLFMIRIHLFVIIYVFWVILKLAQGTASTDKHIVKCTLLFTCRISGLLYIYILYMWHVEANAENASLWMAIAVTVFCHQNQVRKV